MPAAGSPTVDHAVPDGEAPVADRQGLDRLRERLHAYMEKKGLRSTAQRRLIIDAFFEGSSHMTIEDLLAEVRAREPSIGYATVYRTLKLLAECGVASDRHFGDGPSRYELADEATTHHDHLICTSCKRIIEFEEPRIEAIQDEIAERYGFEVHSHKHEMYGICATCSGNGAEKGAGPRPPRDVRQSPPRKAEPA